MGIINTYPSQEYKLAIRTKADTQTKTCQRVRLRQRTSAQKNVAN